MISKLFVGYLPERIRATEAVIASCVSSEGDVIRLGSQSQPLRIADVRLAVKFCSSFPISTRSTHRCAVLDLTACSATVQHALLKFVEEPPNTAQVILTSSELHYILPTIQSRCQTEIFQPGTTGPLLRDLSQRGLSLSSAAQMARQVQYGFSIENAPDEMARVRASGFLDAIRANRLDMALKLTAEFDSRTIQSLRQSLIGERNVAAVIASYSVTRPSGSAIMVIPYIKQ